MKRLKTKLATTAILLLTSIQVMAQSSAVGTIEPDKSSVGGGLIILLIFGALIWSFPAEIFILCGLILLFGSFMLLATSLTNLFAGILAMLVMLVSVVLLVGGITIRSINRCQIELKKMNAENLSRAIEERMSRDLNLPSVQHNVRDQ